MAQFPEIQSARLAIWKRLFDLLLVVVSMPVVLPILLVVAILVRAKIGSPVLFTQTRPGLNAHPFEMVKFRTMRNVFDASGNPLPDQERMTPFGTVLRSSSLDELPELWNVLKGEMSLVGPRPLLMEYLDLYTQEQRRRHNVRPGITGWAQVNGRNALTWDAKFALDSWYVDNQSLWLDLRILWMTLRKVVARDGICAAGEATTPKFTGSRDTI